ncbi:hypothetical protein AB832_07450 [Flavobacteriaceae bacterium (ex Bugula neritina AB1)]|nr:hypothetical protein AB832_07450 [Flavobacteriaceae bacterium (ex Bugula neritina AB1)]
MSEEEESRKLTEKQESFCWYMVETHGHKTKSATLAGYSEDSARLIGSENMRKPYIRARIKEIKRELSKDVEISIKDRLYDLQLIKEAGMQTYIDQDGNERPINLNASNSAISEINKMLGITEDGEDEIKPIQIVFKQG